MKIYFQENGNEIHPPIPVEMYGRYFRGNIRDGDRVRIPQSWQAGQTVNARSIDNLTTSSAVSVHGVGWGVRIGGFVGGILFSVIACLIFQASNSTMTQSGSGSMSMSCSSLSLACYSMSSADPSSTLGTIIPIIFIVIGVIIALYSLFGFNSMRR